MCGDWIQWIKLISPVIFTVHGKRADDDKKEIASRGYLPKSCWVNSEAIKIVQPLTSYSPKGWNRSSDKWLLQRAGLRRWGHAQASARCSVPCWIESETWMQWLLCQCHAVHVRWKSWVFKSWRGYALHRECRKILSFLREKKLSTSLT